MSGIEGKPKDGLPAEHLESCPACAEQWAAEKELWRALEAHGAPELGEEASMRIRRRLSSAARERTRTADRQGRALGIGSWAVVGAAILLGLGAGGWLGLGARELLGAGTSEGRLQDAHTGLFDVADLVFDAAPPGSPASEWFVSIEGGEG